MRVTDYEELKAVREAERLCNRQIRGVEGWNQSNNRITVQTKRPRVPTIKVCKEKTRFDCWGTVWCPLTFPIIADGRTTQTDNFQKI